MLHFSIPPSHFDNKEAEIGQDLHTVTSLFEDLSHYSFKLLQEGSHSEVLTVGDCTFTLDYDLCLTDSDLTYLFVARAGLYLHYKSNFNPIFVTGSFYRNEDLWRRALPLWNPGMRHLGMRGF